MNDSKLLADSSEEELVTASLPELAPGEIVVGTLVALDANSNPLVSYPRSPTENSVQALSTVPIAHSHVGRQVALLFANGDLQKPIVIGFIYSPLYQMLESFSLLHESVTELPANEDCEVFDKTTLSNQQQELKSLAAETIRVDGKRVVIEGEEEVVLTCGDSSITLTKAGKVIIRGKYLVSRASGTNRILGGSVQVN